MPKFNVHFQQWVQELASVEIEAETAEEALKIAHQQNKEDDVDLILELDWADGMESKDREITTVTNAAGAWILNTGQVEDLLHEEELRS